MGILDQPERPERGRRRALAALVALAVAAAVGIFAWLLVLRPAERPAAPAPAARARPTATPRPRPTPSAEPEARATPRPRAEAAPTTLRVDSDVPGANVFLDREFLGTTPVESRDVEPGPHRLNVSAEGYDMYGETIEVATGPNEVVVRFKEVRLDERIDVVHKHGVGSCRGRLSATTAGLRFEADKAGDSFQASFPSLEPLQVDYLKKNLRVKQKGGRTWNFTSESADTLLAFQKAVENARGRM